MQVDLGFTFGSTVDQGTKDFLLLQFTWPVSSPSHPCSAHPVPSSPTVFHLLPSSFESEPKETLYPLVKLWLEALVACCLCQFQFLSQWSMSSERLATTVLKEWVILLCLMIHSGFCQSFQMTAILDRILIKIKVCIPKKHNACVYENCVYSGIFACLCSISYWC